MTAPIRLWICAAHHPAFRCGGWATVRRVDGQVIGVAGGERKTTANRMALAGLVAALRGLPPGGTPILIETASPELTALPDVLGGGQFTPDLDLDLWAQILAVAKGRRLEVIQAAIRPETPMAFLTAWAERAMDTAKARGPFSAAIPKLNLSKTAGFGEG